MPANLGRIWTTAFLSAASVCLSPLQAATPPSREVPVVYTEHIAPLLTPLAEVYAPGQEVPATESNVSILLSEIVHFEADDGLFYRAYHDVFYAHNDAAQSSLGSRTYAYDRDRESLFLVAAATVRSDGERQPVRPDSAFLQAPQYQAAQDLYTSTEELSLVFPSVQAGAVTESIVLVRENRPVWSGQFVTHRTFGAYWPLRRSRLVIDCTPATAARLHAEVSATGVITSTRETPAADRVRQTWQATNRPELHWEEEAPALEFVAPTLWVSTLDSWDEVARWFGDLLAARSELGPELESALLGWTEHASDRTATIARIFDHVANDVRYTGLEFGLAGYQPYACAEVWSHRYGDCKDKANLLRALLVARGIPAHVALVKTAAHGLINRRSPTWTQFDHAIVALPRPEGGFDLLDPTVALSVPGALSLALVDRDVLVLADDRAVWFRTPARIEDTLETEADLTLGADGNLSGWFTLRATGVTAAHYADYYNQWDPTNRRLVFGSLVDDFLPGAEVVDLDYAVPQGAVDAFAIRAFIARASAAASTSGSAGNLTFPLASDWLPSVLTQDTRVRDYHADTRRYRHHGRITLPDGFGAPQVPAAFSVSSAVSTVSAGWEQQPGALTFALERQTQSTRLSPDDYAIFQRSIRSLQHWLQEPVAIIAGASASPATTAGEATAPTAPAADALAAFTLLPTGAGQLRLLETLYPADDGDTDGHRRLALQRTLQWFPDDAETQFTASVYLLQLDAGEAWTADQTAQLQQLLTRFGPVLARDLRAWGEFTAAQARWSSAQDPAAITTLQDLARNPDLDNYRRGWSAYYAGRYLGESEPPAALDHFLTYNAFESDARTAIIAETAKLIVSTAATDRVPAWLQELRHLHAADFQRALTAALLQVTIASDGLDYRNIATFVDALRAELTTEEIAYADTPMQVGIGLRALDTVVSVHRGWDAFYATMAAIAERHEPAWLDSGDATTWESAVAIRSFLQTQSPAHTTPAAVNAAFNLFLHHHENTLDVANALMWALWKLAEAPDRDSPLFEQLGQAAMDLPSLAHPDVIHARTQYGRGLKQMKRWDEAKAVLQQHFENPDLKPDQRVDAHGTLVEIACLQNDADALRENVQALIPDAAAHRFSADYLAVGILLEAESGHHPAARELATVALEGAPDHLRSQNQRWILRSLDTLSRAPGGLEGYWSLTAAWRTAWSDLLARHQVTLTAAQHPLVPLIQNWTEKRNRVHAAAKADDLPAFLAECDEVIRAALLVPSAITDWIDLVKVAEDAKFSHLGELSDFCLLLDRQMPTGLGDDVDRAVRLNTGKSLLRARRVPEFTAWARELARDYPASDSLRFIAALDWAELTAETPAEDEAVANLVAMLADPTLEPNRTSLVTTLLSIYRRRDDLPAQFALARRELENPIIQRSAPYLDFLRTHIEALGEDTTPPAEITAVLATWTTAHGLNWIHQMPPASLSDPIVPAIGPRGMQPNQSNPPAQRIRFNDLLLADESQSQAARTEALALLVRDLATYSDPADISWLQSLIELPVWQSRSRAMVIDELTAEYVVRGWPEHATALAASFPVPFRSFPVWLGHQATVQAVQDLRSADPVKLAAIYRDLTSRPVESCDDTIIRQLLVRLTYAEQDALVDDLLTQTEPPRGGQTARQSGQALKISWVRHVRDQRQLRPFWHAVRDQLTPRFAFDDTDRANAYRFMRGAIDNWLDEAQQARAITAAFAENLLPVGAPENLIYQLTGLTTIASAERDLFPTLFESLLSIDCNDADAARILRWIDGACDVDRPAVARRLQDAAEAFLALNNAQSRRLTRSELRRFLAATAVRTTPADAPPPAALFDVTAAAEIAPEKLDEYRFIYHAARGHWDDVTPIIGRIDPERLTTAYLLGPAIQYWQAKGQPDELDLYADLARQTLTKDHMQLWLEPSGMGLINRFELLRLAGWLKQWDPALEQRARDVLTTPLDLHWVGITTGLREQDWTAVYQHADGILAGDPERYRAHRYRGEAALRLGRRNQAIADLSLMAAKEGNTYQRLIALDLLAEARALPVE